MVSGQCNVRVKRGIADEANVLRDSGEVSEMARETPRDRAVNIRRVAELEKLGMMAPAGRRAFEARSEAKSAIYAYENAPRTLPAEAEKRFRANRKAWEFFSAQPPWYRRVTIYWVLSAKKEETRERRLATLIEDSENGRRIGLLP